MGAEQDQEYSEEFQAVDAEDHRDVPTETILIEAETQPLSHNGHYSDQVGHRERGIFHRAMMAVEALAQAEPDVVSRGQLYIERRKYVPRFPRDGKR